MKLILSGEWLNAKGLMSFPVKGVLFPPDLNSIPQEDGFLIVSYDATAQTLNLPIKRTTLPPIIFLRLGEPSPHTPDPSPTRLSPCGMSLGREDFINKIRKIKEYIASGDVYQINLTSRFDFLLEGDPQSLFLSFYLRQPVPYAFFAQLENLSIISGSMELFLKKTGSRLESRPIKGTGKNPREILSSPKEKAENLMITDMVRNDIGRVARTGSVRVEELFKVERYKTLCQMHSTVVGETDKTLPQILKATFPPASVTGAPKYRAVQIIDLLEPHARGYYCGTAGLIRKNGDFTLSVLIRTAFGGGSKISYFAGCGIVWDSDPEKEWEELLLKVKAFYP